MKSGAPGLLPSGTVTFVFTDIEGSSRLFRRFGDGYHGLLERHNELLREVWGIYGGCEVKTEGDAFFVAFNDAAAALRACVAGQEALAAEPWPSEAEIRVRMGVHAGLAYPRGDDYVAFAVHQAARVVSAAHGGQVLVSASTVTGAAHPVGVVLRSLGHYRLRDFDDPVELLQVEGPGSERHFPALRAIPADGHNLVRPRTAFVGRDAELDELDVAVGTNRLVTITGMGGLGKTRLVTEWGLRASNGWPDGIWMIDLSAVSDPLLIPYAVADSLGVSLAGAADAWVEVVAQLASRQSVLIFDNCEHLTAAVADRVDDLIDGCPAIKVVATSREPLGLSDEHVWRLEPLDAIDDGVQLFIGRAQDVRHGFSPGPDEMQSIAAICQRLDGLPLAIELAAARTAQFRVQEILAGLDQQRLEMRHRDRHVPERQRTMRALLDWSWQLLNPDEQAGLAAIGVFTGSFDLTTATAAMAAEPGLAAETMWSLVDKSLVEVDLTANDTRYRCLYSIRSYAREQLDSQSATAKVAGRLAEHFLERFGPQLDSLDQYRIHERSIEIDNVRGLITMLSPFDQETAQALACIAIAQASYTSSVIDEGLAYLASLPANSVHRVALLVLCAAQALNSGDTKLAMTLLDKAIALRLELAGEAPWDEMHLEQQLGIVAVIRGNPRAALQLAEEALDRATSPRGRERLLNLHAIAATELGDDRQAREFARKALEEGLVRGNVASVMINYCNLAEVALRLGDLTDAAQQQLHGDRIAQQLGKESVIAFSMIIAGRLTATADRWADATRLCANASAVLARNNTPLYPSDQAIVDQLLEHARNALGLEPFKKHYDEGGSLHMSDAIALTGTVLAEFASR